MSAGNKFMNGILLVLGLALSLLTFLLIAGVVSSAFATEASHSVLEDVIYLALFGVPLGCSGLFLIAYSLDKHEQLLGFIKNLFNKPNHL